jgi:hypothetical protein
MDWIPVEHRKLSSRRSWWMMTQGVVHLFISCFADTATFLRRRDRKCPKAIDSSPFLDTPRPFPQHTASTHNTSRPFHPESQLASMSC